MKIYKDATNHFSKNTVNGLILSFELQKNQKNGHTKSLYDCTPGIYRYLNPNASFKSIS